MLTSLLAVIGLAVVAWSALILANKAASRNAPLIGRYVEMRVDQRLEQAFDRLADALDSDAEEEEEEAEGSDQ